MLKANLESPTFTGTVGGLSKTAVGLGNVDNTADSAKPVSTATTTQLNLKANSADVFLKTATYSRTQAEALFTYKIDTYTSPLRLVINPITLATDLRIDPLMDLSISQLTCDSIKSSSVESGIEIRSVADALLAKLFDSGQTQLYNSLDVTGNTTIGGNLTLTGYLAAKPFVSLRVVTGGGTPSTATVIGTAGLSVLNQYGFIQNVTLARGTAGGVNAFIYTFTWATPHPLGINYIVNAIHRTGSYADPHPTGVITANVNSSTSFSLWVRTTVGTTTNVFADGTFYVYTVP